MANEVKDELDEKAFEAAFVAIVDLWDDHRGVDPNLRNMAETSIRAYLLALRPQREDAGAGGGVTTETVTSAEAEVMAQEAYQEGHSDGRSEAKGATVDFWEMAHRWAVQHRFIDEPDGDEHTAQDLMDAILVAFGERKPKRAAPQPSASVVWELEAAKHAHWEAFEGDSSGMVDDAERAKRNMRLWHAIEATLELSAAPQPSAPEGWVLVPREPTEAMMQAGLYQSSADTEWSDIYSMWVDMWDVATGRSVEVVALASPPTGRDATEEGLIAAAPDLLAAAKAQEELMRTPGDPTENIQRVIKMRRAAIAKAETAQKGGKP